MNTFSSAMFKEKQFNTHHLEVMFNTHHPVDFKLPRVAKHSKLLAKDVRLVGWVGRKGCFSVRPLSKGKLDIALYDCDPKDFSEKDVHNAHYRELVCDPGWGFEAIKILIEWLKWIKES